MPAYQHLLQNAAKAGSLPNSNQWNRVGKSTSRHLALLNLAISTLHLDQRIF